MKRIFSFMAILALCANSGACENFRGKKTAA